MLLWRNFVPEETMKQFESISPSTFNDKTYPFSGECVFCACCSVSATLLSCLAEPLEWDSLSVLSSVSACD